MNTIIYHSEKNKTLLVCSKNGTNLKIEKSCISFLTDKDFTNELLTDLNYKIKCSVDL